MTDYTTSSLGKMQDAAAAMIETARELTAALRSSPADYANRYALDSDYDRKWIDSKLDAKRAQQEADQSRGVW